MATNDITPEGAVEASVIFTKVCTKCGEEKSLSEFGSFKIKDGSLRPRGSCKICVALRLASWHKSKRIDPVTGEYKPPREKAPPAKNAEEKKKRKNDHSKRWVTDNKEKVKSSRRDYNSSERRKKSKEKYNNSEKGAQINRAYNTSEQTRARKQDRRKKQGVRPLRSQVEKEKRRQSDEMNRERNRVLDNERYRTNVNVRIKTCVSGRIRGALFRYGKGVVPKSKSTAELVGCTIAELARHLESQFELGMTWKNQGFHGWHIDHKIPCAAFDLSDPEQQKKCFHYSNLQPMWRLYNISKGAKLDWTPPAHIIEATQAAIRLAA